MPIKHNELRERQQGERKTLSAILLDSYWLVWSNAQGQQLHFTANSLISVHCHDLLTYLVIFDQVAHIFTQVYHKGLQKALLMMFMSTLYSNTDTYQKIINVSAFNSLTNRTELIRKSEIVYYAFHTWSKGLRTSIVFSQTAPPLLLTTWRS